MRFDLGLDLFPLLSAVFAAVTCAVLGNCLVLRRLCLMGDAISHSVLPGLVIAFLLAATRNPLVMLLGAAISGIATVVLVELVKKLGRVEPGAAMGVVFSVLFALGVLLIENAAARHVDLDADCVLHGQLETLVWYGAPREWETLSAGAIFDAAPRQVFMLAGACVAAILFVALLFKELRLAAFDAELATAQGFSAPALHGALMVIVAIATVASFEAVGSILVIAMLVCPAASARLLTDRLRPQIIVSVVVAVAAAVLGYLGASAIPAVFGKDSVNAAGSIAVASGALLAAAALGSPTHGVIARALRRRSLARTVALEDVLGALYRADELGRPAIARQALLRDLPPPAAGALAHALARNLAVASDSGIALTPAGRTAAAEVIRRHRSWERYLVDEAGLAPDHVHLTAEQLEHTEVRPPISASHDPHGKEIPPMM